MHPWVGTVRCAVRKARSRTLLLLPPDAAGICLAFDIETAVHSKAAEDCRTPRPAGYYALVSRLAFWSNGVEVQIFFQFSVPEAD